MILLTSLPTTTPFDHSITNVSWQNILFLTTNNSVALDSIRIISVLSLLICMIGALLPLEKDANTQTKTPRPSGSLRNTIRNGIFTKNETACKLFKNNLTMCHNLQKRNMRETLFSFKRKRKLWPAITIIINNSQIFESRLNSVKAF